MDYQDIESISDERFEYVSRLCYKINVESDEYGDECLGGWIIHFYNRLQHGTIKPPFTWEAFCDNEEIIATLEGYGLDVEKFWLVLLFIYDLTCDFGINAADASKTDYDVLVEINDYLKGHPRAVLYLSEDKELRKSERYETNSPLILQELRYFVMRELAKYEEPPQLKIWSNGTLQDNYTESLGAAQQQVLMYKLYKVLFDVLGLPDLRAKKGETVSYSKMLLISRIIYFCRLTTNESFTVDSSSLKGVLKQYGDFNFNQRHPKTYTGGLKLPKNEGE